MRKNLDLSLYLIIDPIMCGGDEKSLRVAIDAINGGVKIIQLRAPTYKKLQLYNLAINLKSICDQYNIVFIIDDHIDVALAVDADGVHIGQEDLPPHIARRILGNKKIIGLSVGSTYEAKKSKKELIDYVGIGSILNTTTKLIKKAIGFEEAAKIINILKVPSVLIGGLNLEHVIQAKKTGADGICVVSAICKNGSNAKEIAKDFIKRWNNN